MLITLNDQILLVLKGVVEVHILFAAFVMKLHFSFLCLLICYQLSECFHSFRNTLPSKFISRSFRCYQSLKPQLTKLIEKENLSTSEIELVWDYILQGNDPAVIGALLTLLRSKGETPQEIAGMVKSMKKASVPVTSNCKLLDIVGTGGDGADTINISTASVVLAAACGCKVAKAGNRSVSSKCGSADVLEALGLVIELTADEVARCIRQSGVGFMYAPIFHPSVKAVAPIRKSLGVRTAFNILGPITNAASATQVVIGVFEDSLVDLIGNTLMEIGSIEHGVVIHGCGLDEISPLGSSSIFEIQNMAPIGQPMQYITKKYSFDPLSVGIPRCNLADLRGGNPEENSQAFRDVLIGGDHMDAKRHAIILNAGVGVYVYGEALNEEGEFVKVNSIEEGIQIAKNTLQKGLAIQKLNEWIMVTKKIRSETQAKLW